MLTGAIIGMARALVEHHDGEVPLSLRELVALPGVGRKTANVVRSVAPDIPLAVIFKGVLPLLAALALAALLVILFPGIALLLPSAMQ